MTLNVRDIERAIDFYVGALGFRVEARTTGGACLAIGAQRIELRSKPDASPYPEQRKANDPWFQHFAIAVFDMAIAYERLSRFSPEPITLEGPQLLPPSTGSVTAYKFRDPDGHPLELSFAPTSAWSQVGSPESAVFLGIDHTALGVRSLDASIAFYKGLGFRLGARSLNRGPEQDRLDGLVGAVVDIVTLLTPEPGPHIELLHYRSPASAISHEMTRKDIAATKTVLTLIARSPAEFIEPISGQRDPDGHFLRFTTS
nr:VOC family protein [Sphingomonas sp.]